MNVQYYRRLRDLREDHDKTQKEISELLDMKEQQYQRYEKGKRDVPTTVLIALADFYHTSTDYLLGRTNDPKAPDNK